MLNEEQVIRELIKLMQMPTEDSEQFKEIAVGFDEVIEKVSKLEPEKRKQAVALLLKALIKYKLV